MARMITDREEKILDTFNNIDFKLLRKQKRSLVEKTLKRIMPIDELDSYNGIIHLLDTFDDIHEEWDREDKEENI